MIVSLAKEKPSPKQILGKHIGQSLRRPDNIQQLQDRKQPTPKTTTQKFKMKEDVGRTDMYHIKGKDTYAHYLSKQVVLNVTVTSEAEELYKDRTLRANHKIERN